MLLNRFMSYRAIALIVMALGLSLNGCVTVNSPNSLESNRDPVKAVKSYVALGVRYMQVDNMEKASSALNRAYEINPDSPEVNEALALFYTRQNEPEQVEKHYKAALREKPDFSKARNNFAAFLYGQERYEDAIEQLELATKDVRYAKRYKSFENLGLCYMQLDRPEEAKQHFRRALQLNSRLPRSQLELAEISLAGGDIKGAEFYLSQNYRINPRPSAQKVWLDLRIAQARDDRNKAASAALALKNMFPKSKEYQAYLKSKRAK